MERNLDLEALTDHIYRFKKFIMGVLSSDRFKRGAPGEVIAAECERLYGEGIDHNLIIQFLWLMARQDGKVWIHHPKVTGLNYEVFQAMKNKKMWQFSGGQPWKEGAGDKKKPKSNKPNGWSSYRPDVYEEQATADYDY